MKENKKVLIIAGVSAFVVLALILGVIVLWIGRSGGSGTIPELPDNQLLAPGDLVLEDGILSYGEVEGADYYLINVASLEELQTENTSVDINESLLSFFGVGTITVTAVDESGEFANSSTSLTIERNGLFNQYGVLIATYEELVEKHNLDITGKLDDGTPLRNVIREIGAVSYTDMKFVVAEGIKEIGDGAFADITSLSKIYLPSTIERIGKNPVAGCKFLEEIIVSTNNAKYGIEAKALYEKESGLLIAYPAFAGIKDVVIPDCITAIGDQAFYWMSGVEKIVMSDGVISIGDSAFMYSAALTEVVLGDSVIEIGENAFSSCANLKSIDLGKSLKEIGEMAFLRCLSLENIVLPDTLEKINPYAFSYCTRLKNIVLPTALNYIGANAFSNCPELSVKSMEITGWRATHLSGTQKGVELDGILTVENAGEFLSKNYAGYQWRRNVKTSQ